MILKGNYERIILLKHTICVSFLCQSCLNMDMFFFCNRYLLYVNDTFLYSGVVPGSTLTLRKPFYMGGVPRNMSAVYVPFALCFQGGMKDLVINSR